MSKERLLTSTSEAQVLGFLGWANLILALLSLSGIIWKIRAYHQLQSFVAGSPLTYGVSGILKTPFYLSLMAGAVLFLLQAYTGWRLLRQDMRIVKACIVVFCSEILYFTSVWVYASYFREGRILTGLHPAIILDLQMVAGYPAAGIALLYWFQKLYLAENGRTPGKTVANQK